MKIVDIRLETVCGPTSALPMNPYPEVAFAGRSNVGKSSLINVLMQRKSLARTSSKPGKTQTINFYRIACREDEARDDFFYLVDLPGYGYAKRSKEESAKWGPMIEKYLKRSAQLKALFILVDLRLKAQESDKQMIEYARHLGKKVIVVATKADKLSKNELAKQTALLKKELQLEEDEPFVPFSALSKAGREDVLAQMMHCLK
ncbi:MAG: YihA family ribosome biogenesis GTP-binding protein [Lachnospiraceae bacterium]|nr:YihA family ribosome biogenesis GTP-binding protein [Lachnospiraceae bacterium]